MTITEFADSRSIKVQTVFMYIKRHYPEFKGHTHKQGKVVILDDIALDLLDKQYPLPKPIQVIEDTESREKLLKAQELIIELQNKLLDSNNKLLEMDRERFLLEDSKKSLEQEIERLKGRNLWERIINKD